ncbi:MAG: hypothetical protein ACPIOQ_72060 [Promethearchaeia archaeon]
MPAVSEHPQMAAGRARAGLPSRRVRGERQKFYAAGFGFDCGSWSLGPDGEGEDEAAADKDGAGMKSTVVRALQG